MNDEMTRQEFAEYMTAFERRLDGRFGRLDRGLEAVDTRLEGIDTSLDGIDTRLDGIDTRLHGIDTRLEGIDTRFDGVDTRFDGVNGRLDGVNGRLDRHDGRFDALETSVADLKHSMTIQFEETRRDIKLSLEAIEGLGERMERGFDEMRSEHANKTAPLEDAVRYVARQAKPREPHAAKKTRRRRS